MVGWTDRPITGSALSDDALNHDMEAIGILS